MTFVAYEMTNLSSYQAKNIIYINIILCVQRGDDLSNFLSDEITTIWQKHIHIEYTFYIDQTIIVNGSLRLHLAYFCRGFHKDSYEQFCT